MIKNFKWVLGLALVMTGNLAFAQVESILQAMDDDNYKRALKLAEDAEEDPETRKDPEVYFLKAEIIYELMKDEYYLKKNPDAFNIGMKALEKGKYRDEDSTITPDYEKLIAKYVDVNNALGHHEFEISKYGKGRRIYLRSYEMNGDTTAYFWEGKCALYDRDTAFGEERYNKLVYMFSEKFAETGEKGKAELEPFLYFADKYWRKESYDTAAYYLDNARKIFGGTPKIDFYQKEIAREQIGQLPPSTLMMEVIDKYLTNFPKDTFLLRKQNALYLYQLRGALRAGDDALADTILNQMANDKVARANSKDKSYYEKQDFFYANKAENVWWKVANYMFENNHDDAGRYVARRYIEYTADTTTDQALKDRWVVIIDYAAKKKSLSLASNLLQMAIADFPEASDLAELRTSLIDQFGGKELTTADLGALNALLEQEVEVNNSADLLEQHHETTSLYIDRLIQDKQYGLAKKQIEKYEAKTPKDPVWQRKYLYLMKEDFYHSYYQTRIVEHEVAGMVVPGFEWNGDLRNCNPGQPDISVQQKVEDRVNYFRRNAGIPEIYLDPELNAWCQEAALMMEGNRKLSHQPSTGWRCYTDEGAYAAQYSLLTEGANTTLAVTSFFADNNSPVLGNRRWLLYPNSKSLGHGSTTNYCALWALDDSGSVDTNLYKEKFVAWPPEGMTPKMMIFKYWSFSLDGDLTGAKVTMKEGDTNIPLKIMDQVEGYGHPTIVWEPEIDAKAYQEDHTITVTVKLKNGRVYTYVVQVINFDPVGY